MAVKYQNIAIGFAYEDDEQGTQIRNDVVATLLNALDSVTEGLGYSLELYSMGDEQEEDEDVKPVPLSPE